jgi:subfamily B ATP-binding cassette protein HlyB/CyaB
VFSGGFQVLASIAKTLGYQVSAAQLLHQTGLGRRAPAAEDLVRAAKMIGLKARLVRDPTEKTLRALPVPAMIKTRDGSWLTFKGETTGNLFRIVDPITRTNEQIPMVDLLNRSGGEVIILAKSLAHSAEDFVFGLSWFIPQIKRYRRPLVEMLVVSFFVNLLALGYPLSFQLVVDKVLPHKSFSTLVVVIVALLLLALFSAILGYIRQYLLQHTANRIDVELGAKLYAHLLHLPISFFESRAAGVIVTRARELRSIRTFLTGQALLTAVDLLFIVVYFGVLFVYSPSLTAVVALSLPFYIAVGAFMRPALRRLLKAKFRSWASGQQLMVESIVGIQTVKAAAVEPIFQRKWDERLAAFAKTSFDAKMLGVTASTAVTFVSKVAGALILFLGVLAVISGKMTIGGLIAFNMIARLISKPIMRIAQLYQDFQEVQVSIEHVADIFNAQVERNDQATVRRAQISGEIAFRNVGFSYKPELPPVLKDISLLIAPGEVIGIVGPSGSGKSTLTKLLQRFHAPTSGDVLIDGIDVAQLDPAWLRRQLGVVLQENFLFNQTVHENIAMARPDMPRAQVIRVARLAGADEFITQMPQGYDSRIEERGANLSGGQRQRLAIARALATNPRILILDEATSALDYESERIIQDNMGRIVQDRTVIIIAHRLAAVRYCDRIVGMVNGEIVEIGTHQELIRRRGGLYAHLWSLQNEHQNP